jgi:SET domain
MSGIFPFASRANHSCFPNAYQTWNGQIKRHNIHAIKDIPVGEEITLSYVSPMLDPDQRRQSLQKRYGFLCTCRACDDKVATTPRQKIYRFNQELISVLTPNPSGFLVIDRFRMDQTLNSIHELTELMLAEGLVSELSWWYVYPKS